MECDIQSPAATAAGLCKKILESKKRLRLGTAHVLRRNGRKDASVLHSPKCGNPLRTVFPVHKVIICIARKKCNLLFEKCALSARFAQVEFVFHTLLTVETRKPIDNEG